MSAKDIKKHEFKKGQSGNPKGRPPKLLTSLMKDLQGAGYERVSPAMVAEAYELLLGMDEDKIKEVVTDKEQPMLIRIVGKSMLSPKGHEILERMMDRAHGRPQQKQSIEATNVLKIIDETDGD